MIDGTCCALFGNITFAFNIGQDAQGGAGYGEFEFDLTSAVSGPLYIYRNTLFNQVNGVIFSGPSSNNFGTVIIANNPVLGTTGGNLISIAHPTGWTLTGNDYWTYGAPVNFSWNGTSYTSFAAWQAATGQEKIAGVNVGLTVDPKIYVGGAGLTNGGYVPANLYAYELQSGSPMIGAGVNLQSQYGITLPSTDYFGATVAASSQTVGAAEGDFGTFVPSCMALSNFLARVPGFSKLDNVNYNSILCAATQTGDLALNAR